MKLTQISATNFKGQTFTVSLSPMTLFIGNNFVGKTARTDAIRLALLGYLPELGKTPRATFGLSSGTKMTVEAVFDTGDVIIRSWAAKGNSVTVDEQVPDAIKDCGQLAVMLNAEEYFALTDRARVDYVFANVEMGDAWKTSQMVERVAESCRAVSPKKELTNEADPVLRLLFKLFPDVDSKEAIQATIESALTTATTATKEAKEYAARMEKTVQGLSTLRAGDQQGADLAQLDAQREKLVAEIQELETRRADTQAKADAQGEIARQILDLARQLSELEFVRATMKRLKESLSVEEMDLDYNKPKEGEETESEIAEKLGSMRANYRSSKDRQAAANVAIRDDTVELNNIELASKCPFCGAAGDGWKVLRTAQLKERIKLQRDSFAKEGEAMETLTAEGKALEARVAELRERRRLFDVATQRKADIEKKINEAGELLGAEPHLEEMLRDKKAKVATVDVAPIVSQLNECRVHLSALDAKRKEAMGRAQELVRLAKAEEERDAAKVEQEIATAAAKELRAIQAEMVTAAFEPLLNRANEICSDILKTPLAYQGGEIGTYRGGIFVGHRTMSGTEKSLTYAAIQAALSSRSPVRVMIIDELGRLDAVSSERLLLSVEKAIDRGQIDSFVGIDVDGAALYSEADVSGLTVVNIG